MAATALHDRLASAPARTGEHHGAATAIDFGNVRGEFESLVSGCGVYDLGWRAKIALTGGDRVRWLNGMVTNNIRDLAAGHGIYAFLLNPQGQILGDLYAYNRGDSLLLDTDRSQLDKMLATFDHYIIMDDVEVANASDRLTAIGLAGPKARQLLSAAGFEFPEVAPLECTNLTWQQIAVTLARGDLESIESYELWLAPAEIGTVWERLVSAGARPVGIAALELLRITSGIPRYGQDIRQRDLPQETGQQRRALNFSKGCYVGQEIVERIRSRGNVHRMFTGFDVAGPLPAPGAEIRVEGKDVGEITSVASLPLPGGERNVALGYIRMEAMKKPLRAGEASLVVSATPFAGVFQEAA